MRRKVKERNGSSTSRKDERERRHRKREMEGGISKVGDCTV